MEIFIEDQDKSLQVYFKLLVITGDNLEIHSMFGLNESFSSIYYCRFCLSTKYVMAKQTKEDITTIRKVQDYQEHLDLHSFGIKEQCVFHKVHDFHIRVYNNLTCDIMHDVYEGVHRYVMPKVINYLISKKYFSLETLNSRVRFFQYDTDERNVPPVITKESLKNGYIVFSASEMPIFVTNFCIFIIYGFLEPLFTIIPNHRNSHFFLSFRKYT